MELELVLSLIPTPLIKHLFPPNRPHTVNLLSLENFAFPHSGECASERGRSPLSELPPLSKQMVYGFLFASFGEGDKGGEVY